MPGWEYTRALGLSFLQETATQFGQKGRLQGNLGQRAHKLTTTIQRCRCRVCGRTHFVLQRFGLARMMFRQLAGLGHLRGVASLGF